MKTHRSTQLFLYFSGDERSVKYIRPALEMEAEQRGVARFLVARVLRRAIKSKPPEMLSDGIFLLHDNARPHTANLVRDKLQGFGWETLKYPPYSPDISPCDVHIFGDLKKGIRGPRVGFIQTRKCKCGCSVFISLPLIQCAMNTKA